LSTVNIYRRIKASVGLLYPIDNSKRVPVNSLVLLDLESEDAIILRNVGNYVSSIPINITLLDPAEEGMMIFKASVAFDQLKASVAFDQLTRRNIPEGFTVRSSIKVFNVSNKI
jgi:hypothetical protein